MKHHHFPLKNGIFPQRKMRLMMERKLIQELGFDFLRVVEAAAIASAHTMGQGERKYSDHVAVEAMRKVMDTVPMRGEIVIGEGEGDEAAAIASAHTMGQGERKYSDHVAVE